DIDGPFAGNGSDGEPEFGQDGGPLRRFDGDAVPTAEAEGNKSCGRPAQRRSYGPVRRRLVASSTARESASGSLPPRTIADPETISSCGGTTNTRVATATWRWPRGTKAVVSTSALSAPGTSWRKASSVACATARLRDVAATDPSANPV